MPPLKGSKIDRGYATTGDDGVNYRDIADSMTSMGFKMNHSSARNYILRVMKKFAIELSSEWEIPTKKIELEEIAKSPGFQKGISEILKEIKEIENFNNEHI